MSRIDSKPYNEFHIQNIRRMLELSNRNGQPLYFEFKVDGMVFIPHTNQVDAFDEYKDFLYQGAEEIEFNIFSSNPLDKNRKTYAYYLKEPKQELNGLDIKTQVNQEIERFKAQHEIAGLQKELKEKENIIVQQDEWIAQIQEKVKDYQSKYEQMKANPNHFGQWDLGKLLGSMATEFVRQNPKALDKIPLLNGISNAITPKGNSTSSNTSSPDRKVSFEVKEEDSETELSEEDKFHIGFGNKLTSKLNDEQIDCFYSISEVLITEPSKLSTVAELLDIKN